MKKKERGDATRPWSRHAMSVSARDRGHLEVARKTIQQQGMADEVVFTLVLSISSMVRVWLSRKQASSIGYSVQIVPYPSRGNRSLSKFSPSGSLEPRPSSPPDLRPSGRGPGKTSILFRVVPHYSGEHFPL